MIVAAIKANPAKAGDAKPRVLESSATLAATKDQKIAGLPLDPVVWLSTREAAMRNQLLRVFFFIIIGSSLLGSQAGAVDKKVDCDKGQTITKALESADRTAETLAISVTGTCEEFVRIGRDRVSIESENGATVIGQITIFGPSNVTLRNLTITGPGNGLRIFGGRTRVFNVNLIQNEENGIFAADGAVVRFEDGQITDNNGDFGVLLNNSEAQISSSLVSGHRQDGLAVTLNSSLTIVASNVSGNSVGISISRTSSLELIETEVTGNHVFGVLLSNNSSGTLVNPTITNNARQGLELGFNSSADVLDGWITGNGENGIYLSFHSMVGVFGTHVTGNGHNGVALVNDSGALFGAETFIPANNSGWALVCIGKESSFEIQPPATVGPTTCPDPGF
jgi:hypothetical protein